MKSLLLQHLVAFLARSLGPECTSSPVYIFSSFFGLCQDGSSKYRTASGQELDLLQNALTLEECRKPASVCLACTETSKRGKNACRRSSFILPPLPLFHLCQSPVSKSCSAQRLRRMPLPTVLHIFLWSEGLPKSVLSSDNNLS